MKPRIHHLREPICVALETLRAHKMRSFLMLLGIVLSVSTLIMVVALISGVNLYVPIASPISGRTYSWSCAFRSSRTWTNS